MRTAVDEAGGQAHGPPAESPDDAASVATFRTMARDVGAGTEELMQGDGSSVDPPTEDSYQLQLGARLRAVRRSRGLRLQDVETKSDGRFKAVVIGSYERGDRAVSAHRLAELADFYGTPMTDLLPGDPQPRTEQRGAGVRIAVDRLRVVDGHDDAAPLVRLVQYVQRLRGDYNGRVLTLRGDDLRTVAVALGVSPEGLGDWLRRRDLLAV